MDESTLKAMARKLVFSESEKEILCEEGKRYGIKRPRMTNCPDCWRDYAINIILAKRKEAKHAN